MGGSINLDDGLIRKVIRESISLVEQERGYAPVPSTVVDSPGNQVSLDALFGGRFVQRRLGLGHGARGSTEAPPAECQIMLLKLLACCRAPWRPPVETGGQLEPGSSCWCG